MDIHLDTRGFLEIQVWICYEFSDREGRQPQCADVKVVAGRGTFFLSMIVLSSQNVLSGSGRTRRLRLMGRYIDHRLLAQPEPDWTDRKIGYWSRVLRSVWPWD